MKRRYFISILFSFLVFAFSSWSQENKKLLLHFFGLPDHMVFGLNSSWNRDNSVRPFHELRNVLTKKKYNIKTFKNIKAVSKENVRYIIFFNLPHLTSDLNTLINLKKKNLVAFLWEPPIKKYANYRISMHKYFRKIFTWDDDLVDGKKYLKIYYPQPSLKMIDNLVPFHEKQFCALIARNQISRHPLEICSERTAIIDFFNKIHESEFHLYGSGWDSKYSSYKGKITSKTECLKKYKFCICYENTWRIKGYITEKIFDCFIAGCVPVYLGADNIEKYIPTNCFIDRRNFKNNQELYLFLKNMNNDRYAQYIKAIKDFLVSDQAHLFSIENFINIFIQGLQL